MFFFWLFKGIMWSLSGLKSIFGDFEGVNWLPLPCRIQIDFSLKNKIKIDENTKLNNGPKTFNKSSSIINAAFSFSYNYHWPTFQQRYQDTAMFPPPPELLIFHDNLTFSNICINNPLLLESNHQFSSFNDGVTTTNLSKETKYEYDCDFSLGNRPGVSRQDLVCFMWSTFLRFKSVQNNIESSQKRNLS